MVEKKNHPYEDGAVIAICVDGSYMRKKTISMGPRVYMTERRVRKNFQNLQRCLRRPQNVAGEAKASEALL